MVPAIYRLDNTNEAKGSIYGNKIGVLSKLATLGVRVPRGYYFTINPGKGSKHKYRTHVKEIFSNLKKSNDTILIVRSSMSVEDSILHQFPGIFLSKKNISSENELFQAISDCVKSKNSELAYRYVDPLKSISLRNLKVSILIQEQISVKYFGLAEIKHNEFNYESDFITIELTKYDSFELVKGRITPSALRVYRESKSYGS